mgnify:CR=1 FL=1
MADINSKLEIGVTTGPIRGSRKVHVGPLRVAMREITLEPGSGEAPVRVYDPSGPYTDPDARIDIAAGLPELRRDWIRGRGDVEAVLAEATAALDDDVHDGGAQTLRQADEGLGQHRCAGRRQSSRRA